MRNSKDAESCNEERLIVDFNIPRKSETVKSMTDVTVTQRFGRPFRERRSCVGAPFWLLLLHVNNILKHINHHADDKADVI